MPFDPKLADRLRVVMTNLCNDEDGLEERKMFGGICFSLNGNMCLGIHKDRLIARVGVEAAAKLLKEAHVRPMDLTGKPMKGWIMAEAAAIKTEKNLAKFCGYAAEFVRTLPAK